MLDMWTGRQTCHSCVTQTSLPSQKACCKNCKTTSCAIACLVAAMLAEGWLICCPQASTLCRVLGDSSRVKEAVPTLAGEDFSFYSHLAGVPSCFTFLGIRNENLGSVHGLHTPKFKLDESVLRLGAALHAGLATEFLASYPNGLPDKDEL